MVAPNIASAPRTPQPTAPKVQAPKPPPPPEPAANAPSFNPNYVQGPTIKTVKDTHGDYAIVNGKKVYL